MSIVVDSYGAASLSSSENSSLNDSREAIVPVFFDPDRTIQCIAMKILEELSFKEMLTLRCVNRATNVAILALLAAKKSHELRYWLPFFGRCLEKEGKLPVAVICSPSLRSSVAIQPPPVACFQHAIAEIKNLPARTSLQQIRDIKRWVAKSLYQAFSSFSDLPEIDSVARSRIRWVEGLKITAQWRKQYPAETARLLARIGLIQESANLYSEVQARQYCGLCYELAIARAKDRDFSGAKKTARFISDELCRARALIDIALLQYKNGDIKAAKELISDTKETVAKITGNWNFYSFRGMTWAEVSEVQAIIAAAEVAIGSISIEEVKRLFLGRGDKIDDRMKVVLEAFVKKQDLSSVEKIVNEYKVPSPKGKLWLYVGYVQQECGDCEGAKKSALRAGKFFYRFNSEDKKNYRVLSCIALQIKLKDSCGAKALSEELWIGNVKYCVLKGKVKSCVLKFIDRVDQFVNQKDFEGLSEITARFDKFVEEMHQVSKVPFQGAFASRRHYRAAAVQTLRTSIAIADAMLGNNLAVNQFLSQENSWDQTFALVKIGVSLITKNEREKALKILALTEEAAERSFRESGLRRIWGSLAFLQLSLGKIDEAKKSFDKIENKKSRFFIFSSCVIRLLQQGNLELVQKIDCDSLVSLANEFQVDRKSLDELWSEHAVSRAKIKDFATAAKSVGSIKDAKLSQETVVKVLELAEAEILESFSFMRTW